MKRWNTTNTSAVTLGGTVALGAGSAAIGSVTVLPAAAAFQSTGTVTTAGTRVTLGSNACTVGFYVTNTHATAILYVGTAAAVSSSAFIYRLLPGQTSPLIPLNNSNLLGIDASANGGTVSFGGF